MSLSSKLATMQRLLRRIESGFLILILTTTILFAVIQIFLRNVMHSGIPWGDTLVRILVLWLGLVGAMIASREHRHIRIDILSRHLSPHARRMLGRLTDSVAAVICTLVAWYSLQFIKLEYADGIAAFEGVPVWLMESIIPFAFLVMALRYLLSAIKPPALQDN